MKCPACVREGRPSRVFDCGASKTLLGWSPYYDDAGVYHAHDPNRVSQTFKCANGHWFGVDYYEPCPADGCERNSRPDVGIPQEVQ